MTEKQTIPTEDDVRRWLQLQGYHYSYLERHNWIEIVAEFARYVLEKNRV